MMLRDLRRNAQLVCTMAAFAALLGTAACARGGMPLWREEAANRLAVPANLHRRQVTADPFSIAVFERVYAEGKPATIYFEGDGENGAASRNPTPDYPVGLHLATRDLSDNVIYIARPCQYSGTVADDSKCPKEFWGDRRYSLEVMESMNTALDKLKRRYDIRGFNLVGYDGGAAVATMLAAKRGDVLSLRTVAGNLDSAALNAKLGRAPLTGSMNPRDFAADVAHIPQHHFIGVGDKVVDSSIYESFRNAMGPSTCARYSIVDETTHEEGWVNRWPSLLEQPLDCNAGP